MITATNLSWFVGHSDDRVEVLVVGVLQYHPVDEGASLRMVHEENVLRMSEIQEIEYIFKQLKKLPFQFLCQNTLNTLPKICFF